MAIKTTVPREMIAPAKWDRLKDILDEALAEPSTSARAAVIARRCQGDALLVREAQSLIAEAETFEKEPTDWLEECAEEATRAFWSEELSRDGQRIGAYVVVRQLGRGGMGAVYLAERADGQFEKQVAIKVLKRGTDTEEILHRFAIERRIVARLDHPNIARLLDAGTTEDGLPYFVMEFVDGDAGDAVRACRAALDRGAAEVVREDLRCGRGRASLGDYPSRPEAEEYPGYTIR